jgi:N-acetylmuramoyl-L-alanine amidase-like protein
MERTTIGNAVPFSKLVLLGLSILVFSSLTGCNQPTSDLPRPEVRAVSIDYAPLRRMPAPRIEARPRSTSNVPAGWIPPSRVEDRKRWRGIIVHHSATSTGNAVMIDTMHKKRKDRNGEAWLGLGYHFVISNGRGGTDGKVEVGFRWPKQMTGAHCRPRSCTHNYWNEHTIGICLVGNFEHSRPTPAQYNSLAKLIRFLKERYPIPANAIQGHGDVAGAKTACPGRNFSWWTLRQRLGGTFVTTE